MKWITRAHVHVDRVACPWLITRFIDSEAELLLVARSQVLSPRPRRPEGGSCRQVAASGGGPAVPSRVEMRGFEPLTPWMQTRCSAGLSYIPAEPILRAGVAGGLIHSRAAGPVAQLVRAHP